MMTTASPQKAFTKETLKLFDFIGDAVFVVSSDGLLLDANLSATLLLDLTHEELLAKQPRTKIFQTLKPTIADLYQQSIVCETHPFEVTLTHKDGHAVPVEIRCCSILFCGKSALLVNARDLTEQKHTVQALWDSEKRFQNIFQETQLGIHMYHMNFKGTLTFCGFNPAADKILGVDNSQFLGQSLLEAFPTISTEVQKNYLQVALTGKPWTTEQVEYQDNQISGAFEIHAFQTSENNIACMFMEITTRKKAEEALRESEERVRLLLESSGEAIYGTDLQGGCTFCNPSCLSLLGYHSDEDLLGKNMHELIHYKRLDNSLYQREECRIYKSFLLGKEVHVDDEVFWRADATSFPVEYWSFPVRKDGEVVGSVVNFIDISERKFAEEELQAALTEAEQSREQVRAILRSAADGLIVIDLQGKIVLANDAIELLLGCDMGSMSGRALNAVISDQNFLERVEQALAGAEQTRPLDVMLAQDNDGPQWTLQARVASVYGSKHEKIHGAVAILRDVTQERALDHLKDDFISSAAHELRTPLTSILGYSELILEQLETLDQGQLTEFVGIISDRSKALVKIVGDMLDLSRVQSGRLIDVKAMPGNVTVLLSQAMDHYRFEQGNLSFDMKVQDNLPMVLIDPDKIAQVLDNLVSNAVKYSPEGGIITLQAEVDDTLVNVKIADCGIGVGPEQLKKVFDKFYRVDTTNTSSSGLGLGMSLVKAIIEAHNGDIWMESNLGVGTTVCFTLPIYLESETLTT